MFLAKYRWFRKWRGGIWYENRYWFDAGVTCYIIWERHHYSYGGGPLYTIRQENYIVDFDEYINNLTEANGIGE